MTFVLHIRIFDRQGYKEWLIVIIFIEEGLKYLWKTRDIFKKKIKIKQRYNEYLIKLLIHNHYL